MPRSRLSIEAGWGCFRRSPTANRPSDLVLEAAGEVPSGAAPKRFRAETLLPADIHALALRPDVQSGVKSIEVAARKPDGGTEVLLFADGISLDWPTPTSSRRCAPPQRRRISATAYYASAAGAPSGGIRLTVSEVLLTRAGAAGEAGRAGCAVPCPAVSGSKVKQASSL